MTIVQMYKEVKGYCSRTPYCTECRLVTPDAVCGWDSTDDISTEDCYCKHGQIPFRRYVAEAETVIMTGAANIAARTVTNATAGAKSLSRG